jgi:prevent-host-death family protein
MKSIGTLEARRNLSALLERIRRGEKIVITRRGKAVARLVPVGGWAATSRRIPSRG